MLKEAHGSQVRITEIQEDNNKVSLSMRSENAPQRGGGMFLP